jgi:hypothetical protein
MGILFFRTNKLAVPFNRYKHPNLNIRLFAKKITDVHLIEYQWGHPVHPTLLFICIHVRVEIDLQKHVKGSIVFPSLLFIIVRVNVL